MYIARIERVNPTLHAVSEINPDSIDIARERDEERAIGNVRGPLHGVPILVKDVFLTTDRMQSTGDFLGFMEAAQTDVVLAGSTALLGAQPKFEATVIQKLRTQGAIILGKTVGSQWANYRSPGQIPSGWSAVGGQCRGAYVQDQDPSGSSAGSAVATALGLAAAALGTEVRFPPSILALPAHHACRTSQDTKR